jgi:hypothetical protein
MQCCNMINPKLKDQPRITLIDTDFELRIAK